MPVNYTDKSDKMMDVVMSVKLQQQLQLATKDSDEANSHLRLEKIWILIYRLNHLTINNNFKKEIGNNGNYIALRKPNRGTLQQNPDIYSCIYLCQSYVAGLGVCVFVCVCSCARW